MKYTKVLFSSIIVTAILVSCTKKDSYNIESISLPTNNKLDSTIGFYHNEALNYIKNDSLSINYKSLPLEDFELIMNSVEDYLVNDLNFTTSEVSVVSNDIISNCYSLNCFYTENDITFVNKQIYLSIDTYFSDLINKGIFSSNLSTIGDTLKMMLKNNVPHSTLSTYVNNLDNQTWTVQQADYIDTFIDVFNQSSSYWNGTKADGDDVIIADACGALHGLIWGPIGSIIEGAIVSVIANNVTE